MYLSLKEEEQLSEKVTEFPVVREGSKRIQRERRRKTCS